MFSAVGAGLACFLYFGVYPLFSIYSEFRREDLDIDIMATILQGLPLVLAYLPSLFCVYYASIQARRLRAGEIHFTTAQKLIRIALPNIIALSAFIAAHVLVLSRLSVVFRVPQALDKYELFKDDRLIDKAPAFEPELLDSRPFDGYQINASAAVIALGIKSLHADSEKRYSKVYPGYAAAAEKWGKTGRPLLPSLNMLDGKAKQFDDGMLAALMNGAAAGRAGPDGDLSGFLKTLLVRLNPRGKAYAWIWGGLKTGDLLPPGFVKQVPQGAEDFIAGFQNKSGSGPIGFYTWAPELENIYRLFKYFQEDIGSGDPRAIEIVEVLARDKDLKIRYDRLLGWFYNTSMGTARGLSFSDLANPPGGSKSVPIDAASLLPPGRSKEDLLFQKIFPDELTPGADLMLEMVKAVRAGKLDLKPGAGSGWYEYQVYALETFLLPERGPENIKLLLSKEYKIRMLKAFAALLTKRRETQALTGMVTLGGLDDDEWPNKTPLSPRLRVEPNPTYFIRMARSYAFMEAFLLSAMPAARLDTMRGFREGGRRGLPLGVELRRMKNLFYGLHLLSCEDIGMKAMLLDGELDSKALCIKTAQDWLKNWRKDPDLSADTRVIVPIASDPGSRVTRFWCTLGVRALELETSYVRAPSLRSIHSKGKSQEWQEAETTGVSWIILVDDFAEFESKRPPPSREEFRAIVDRAGTKEEILRILAD